MYVPDISRFFDRDICRKIAESTTLALRIGNVDITGFDGRSIFQIRWRYLKNQNLGEICHK